MINFFQGDKMNNLLISFFGGLLATAFLFAISFFTVIGVKKAYYKILETFPKKHAISKKEKQEQPAPRKKRAPIRSIEINPEEIDRIYVKKTG